MESEKFKNGIIYNADCLDIFRDISDESIDCVVSDIPYKIIAGGIRIVYQEDECGGMLNKRDYSRTDSHGILSRGRKVIADGNRLSQKWIKKDLTTPSVVKDGKMFRHNDIKFADWLPDVYRILKRGTHCYLMINGRNLKTLQSEAEKAGFVYQNLLVWKKANCTPNKFYMQSAEFILMLSKRPARNINDMGAKTVIEIPNIIGKKIHPTQKPIALMEFLIKNSTNVEEIVLDMFAGAGSTVIAANNLTRQFIGIEIDNEYYELMRKQLKDEFLNDINELNLFHDRTDG